MQLSTFIKTIFMILFASWKIKHTFVYSSNMQRFLHVLYQEQLDKHELKQAIEQN